MKNVSRTSKILPVSFWLPTMFEPVWSVVPLEKYSAIFGLLFGSSNLRWPTWIDRLLSELLLTVHECVAVKL